MALKDHLANPQLLLSLYGEDLPEVLAGVRIRSVNLDWRGPTARLRIDLPGFPRTPPVDWGDLDTVQCQLEFLAVERIAMAEWEPPAFGDVRMMRLGDGDGDGDGDCGDGDCGDGDCGVRRMRVEVAGRGVDLRFESHESATVRHVSAFRRGASGEDDGPQRFVSGLDSRLHTFLPPTDEETFYEH
ncbi:Imm50 family immunity protein [Streptomyces sp. NPDC051014]|uniref:Imm50 family immunity protein n=1 Tax=Streptomyces sp. NPDC051014 TaxID=3155751 RepID=UPI0033DC0308